MLEDKVLRMLWRVHPMTHNDLIAAMTEMSPLEIKLNRYFTNFYNKCKSHESQLMQMIIKVTSNNDMSPMCKNNKNFNKVDIIDNHWFLHRNMIVDDVVIRELIDVHENYKSMSILRLKVCL